MKLNYLVSSLVLGALLSPTVYANTAPVTAQLTPTEITQIAHGEYLADIGDCSGCHTAPQGQPYAGGVKFKIPVGYLYATNISSDKQYGIGKYTYQQFARAMRDGVAPRGNLYPVMPYTSYRLINNSDMHDLYLYFMHTKPVAEPNKKNDIDFPFDMRWGISVWNWLELNKGTFHPIPGKTALWNRGNYLISGLGHCSECHTPRNLLMSPEFSKQFQGSMIDGIMAPNITPQELKRQGWTMESLTHLQQSGTSVKGSAFADMYIVEHDSLSSLDRYDRQAIAAYLLNENVNYNPLVVKYEKIPLIFKENSADGNQEGFALYNNDCAGCHGSDGQGKPNVVPTLQGNATLNHTSSYNTIAVIINGIPKEYYNPTDSFYPMPGFGQSLTNKQIAQLTNYLRHRWTTQKNTITEKTVEEVRKKLTPTSSSI